MKIAAEQQSQSTSAIRVVLVDDQELIRTGFALILATEPDIHVLGEAADGAAAVTLIDELVSNGHAPDVVLMDVRMPVMNGIEATAALTLKHPAIRVLVLTTFDLDEYAAKAIEAGASGFLLKDARAAELIHAVRSVAEGDAVLAPTVTKRLLMRLRETSQAEKTELPVRAHEGAAEPVNNENHSPLDVLTEREREVFELIAAGLSNLEIGEQLFLSPSTVKTHIGRVLAKLQLRDRVHAVILAYEQGIK